MWTNSGRYRMPDGARIVSQRREAIELQVSMPTDGDGFFGRQCPSCSQLFRVDAGDYDALPDDVELWCVYCGHHDGRSEFITEQQRERALRAAGDLGVQMVDEILGPALRRMARPRSRSRSGFGITVSVRSRPFYPKPLPRIDEERLIRIRSCAGCALRYAVFGEHRFCPVCGALPPGIVGLDALAAETARLDSLAQLPATAVATLREQGVFTRIWVDTLENLVGVVETLAGAVFRAAVTDAEQRLKGKGNIFQRLGDTADLFVDAGYADLRTRIDPAVWRRLSDTWAARHVFTHNDGVVDAKYLAKVPTSTARAGQRLTISEPVCRQAITDVAELCRTVAALTAP